MAKRRKIKALEKMTKSQGKMAKIEVVEDDRISELPDCILVDILSLLPTTRDAIRTGTVSKRWKSVWTAVTNLVFIQYGLNWSYSDKDFVGSVNKALIQRGNQYGLNKLKVCFDYEDEFKGSVDSWILCALIFKVEMLEILLRSFNDVYELDYESEYLLPEYFYATPYLKNLYLHGCNFDRIEPVCWKSLKTLNIWQADISDDAIKNILSGSSVLEHLELGYCHGFERLEISSKSLKKFVLAGYSDPNDPFQDGMVEVYAPNIVSLDIEGSFLLSRLFFRDISSVVEAKVDFNPYGWSGDDNEILGSEDEEEILKELLRSLRHLDEVKIGDLCYEMFSRLEPKGFPFSLPKIIRLPSR